MMVTKIRNGARAHLYLDEWFDKKGATDEAIANRIGVARETITRWRGQQHRLNPEKIAALAAALDVAPMQLWSPPSRPSVDAMLDGLGDDMAQRAAELVAVILKTGT